MPPKIATLVQFFEQRQLDDVSASASSSPGSSRHGSPTNPTRPQQRRHTSVPAHISATASTSTPVIARALATSTPRSVSLNAAPTLSNPSPMSNPTTGKVSKSVKISTGKSPSTSPAVLGSAKASPLVPLEHKTNATNVSGEQARNAILQKLYNPKSQESEPPVTASTAAAETPIPIKERFRTGRLPIVEVGPSEESDPVPSYSSHDDDEGKSLLRGVTRAIASDSVSSLATLVAVDSNTSTRRMKAKLERDHNALEEDEKDPEAYHSPYGSEGILPKNRPSLPNSHSNGKLSTLTADVPAYNVFASDAKALDLPLLDDYIDNIPKVTFSQPEKVMSVEEIKGWNEWLAGGQQMSQPSLLHKLTRMFRSKRGSYAKMKDPDQKIGASSQEVSEHAKRALIFPPMHRLPPNITVTDLIYNRSSKAPLVSLNVLLATGIDAVLGAEGSTYAVSLIRVEAFRDLIQIIGSVTNFAKPTVGVTSSSAVLSALRHGLSNSTIADSTTGLAQLPTVPHTRYVILTVIPSMLGLDFVSAFGKAILWLWVFTALCFVGCWEFRYMANQLSGPGRQRSTSRPSATEGLDSEGSEDHEGQDGLVQRMKWHTRVRHSRAYRICVVFMVTSLYLPLSKIAIGALAWTSDYWPVDNYYLATDDPKPSLLGPADHFRDPLDFCYTTTMRTTGLNWAIPIMMVASVTVLVVTIWFPIRLWLAVQNQVPKVDLYTELGERRRDLRAEYNRLLERDESPLSFIYNEYRKPWAGFKSAYMALKLINVLCITLLTKDNCIFRHRHRATLDVIRQSTILGFMVCWMVLQIWAKPFNDRFQNNSDWCSRIAYVVIAILGLAAALKLPGKAAYGGWLLVLVTAVSYLFNGYFACVGTLAAQRMIKTWQRRLDFSIDVFSPELDTAKHVMRRIQQETLSTLLLAEPEFKIKEKKGSSLVFYNVANEKSTVDAQSTLPPYLLGFKGSQGERHVENLQVLREIGLCRYVAAVARHRSPLSRLSQLQATILHDFTGPDCVYWSPSFTGPHFRQNSFFGKATALPFPFTLIFEYDENGKVAYLTDEKDLETYVAQNTSPEAVSGRRVRLALRALEGCRVYYPYITDQAISSGMLSFRKSEEITTQIRFSYGVLRIERNAKRCWRGYNFNSGFEVTLHYQDGRYLKTDGQYKNGVKAVLTGEQLGLAADFAVTATLARLLNINREVIEQNTLAIIDKFESHRRYFREEIEGKASKLSYAFLTDIYANEHLDRFELETALAREKDASTKAMAETHSGAVDLMRERMRAVNSNSASQWWYLLWDDIYRRNSSSVAQLRRYEHDFSPKYRSSICYKPMTRRDFMAFLTSRGLWEKDGRKGFFTHGILNRIYFYLDQMLFEGTRGGIPVKIGFHRHAIQFHELGTLRAHDAEDSYGQESKLSHDTGQGTDHDESFVRSRPAFLFEEIYDRPPTSYRRNKKAYLAQVARRASRGVQVWFGIRPHESASTPPSLFFSLKETSDAFKPPRRGGS